MSVRLPQVAAAAICIWVAATSYGQESLPEAAPDPAAQLTAESVTQLKTLAAASIEDESLKSRVGEIYQEAIDQLSTVATLEAQLAAYGEAKDSAERRATAIRRQLDAADEAQIVDGTLPLSEVEQQLVEAEQHKSEVAQLLDAVNDRIASRSARRIGIRERLLALQKQKDETEDTATTTSNDPLSAAKRIEQLALRRRIQTEAETLQAELASIDAEDVVDLPRIERDLRMQQSTIANRMVEALQLVVSQKRKEDAQTQVELTEGQAQAESHPVLRKLAERNESLAKQYQSLTKLIEDVDTAVASAGDELKKIEDQADGAKKKVETIGLTDAIGKMLRKEKRALPGKRPFLIEIRHRSESISTAQLELLELEDERARDVEQSVRKLNDDDELPLTSEILEQARGPISQRNEQLMPLIRAQSQYFDSLVELSNKQQQIVQKIRDFEEFIDERVLWVRSSRPLYSSLMIDRDDFWLMSPSRWDDAGRKLFVDFSVQWGWYVLATIVMLGLLRNRFAFRHRIQGFGEQAMKNTCITFWPTVATLLLTLIAALAWPPLVALCSWRCFVAADKNEILRGLSHGLFCVAAGYLPIDMVRLACKPHGLVESHLGWSASSIEPIRRALRVFAVMGLPLVLLATMMSVGSDRIGRETLERIPFIAITLILSWFLHRLLNADRGIFREYLLRFPQDWFSRLHPVWYGIGVFSPLMLTGLSFLGFHYTAQQLAWRLFLTVCSVLAVFFFYGVASRWLWIQRRRLSIEQSKKRRAAQLQADSESSERKDVIEIPSIDELRGQVKQSRSLLKTSMVGVALLAVWFTWVDVLPALSFLEKWPLWISSVQVTEMVETDDGEARFTTRDVVDKITIADLAFAVFFFVLMIVAARNIPGVLEISVLQRLPIETAVRYAITTVVRYAIILLGIFVSCQSIGIHWNQVQWMATALTFGLAFGLQEMFANFIAGIIILFERPIRVGDIVTVDEVTGTVSKVRIRATTITNWDRKDYIVPNKDFITGRVLNWTLSDNVNRIVINIGLAYGSDKELAIRTLKRIAYDHPRIEDDPAPSVTFEAFGNSTLDFVLRCYISMKNMPHRLTVVHELHSRIDDAFRAANIEIAFPQQDVNVRTLPSENLDSWKS